jgi:hypothetical protein
MLMGLIQCGLSRIDPDPAWKLTKGKVEGSDALRLRLVMAAETYSADKPHHR